MYNTDMRIELIENGYEVMEYHPYAKNRRWYAGTLEDAFEIIRNNQPRTVEQDKTENNNTTIGLK